MAPSPEPQPSDWHETLVDLLAMDRGIPEDRARRFLARHAEEVRATSPDEEALAEARSWARHGYEIGQRSCTWSDHGVAPDWLANGWPLHFEDMAPSSEHPPLEDAEELRQKAVLWERAAQENGELYSGAENQRDAAREQLAEARATIARVQVVAREWEFMSGRTAARRELLAALEVPVKEQQR